jgi:hypothetical protein
MTVQSLHIVVKHSTYRGSSQAVSEHQEGVPSDWEVVLDKFEPLLKFQNQKVSDKCVVL